MNNLTSGNPDGSIYDDKTVYGLLRFSCCDYDDLYEYLTEFGKIADVELSQSKDCASFRVTFSSAELVKVMLMIRHDLDGFPMVVSDRPISSTPSLQLVDHTTQVESFSNEFQPTSLSIVQIQNMLNCNIHEIDKKNLRAFRCALLDGSLSEYCGKYVVVNDGVVEYNHIYVNELDSIGKFSSATATTLKIPLHPNEVLRPIDW